MSISEISQHDHAELLRSEAKRAGISASQEHTIMAAGWRTAYESAARAVREMDCVTHEPAAIFIPVDRDSPSETESQHG